ncbi:MAG TPA: hypothetical protein VMX97_09090 [Hyphomicrobiaceae bacterium]|nr:hypothetical protein [Hyphomicrobiaceae bacterium]
MADTISAAIPRMNDEMKPGPERTVYAASGVHKTAFAFVFLILLPFFVSLPFMFFWRLSQGHWQGTIGLAVLGLGFAFIMFLLVMELMHALRARVAFGDKSVKMTLPSGRGPTPMLRYKSYDIPYDQIQAVETQREIYGGKLTPVLLKDSRLILKDGSIVNVGFVSEANMDPSFPFPQIAGQIAERAGVSVTDRGNVRRSFQKAFLGLKKEIVDEAEGNVEQSEIDALNKQHHRWMMWLIWTLVALVVVGIALDIIFPPSSGLPPALTSLKSLIISPN